MLDRITGKADGKKSTQEILIEKKKRTSAPARRKRKAAVRKKAGPARRKRPAPKRKGIIGAIAGAAAAVVATLVDAERTHRKLEPHVPPDPE